MADTESYAGMRADIKYIRESVDEVKAQVKKTNGRVSTLEDDKIRRDTQLRMIGYALTLIIGVGTAVAVAWLISHLGLR